MSKHESRMSKLLSYQKDIKNEDQFLKVDHGDSFQQNSSMIDEEEVISSSFSSNNRLVSNDFLKNIEGRVSAKQPSKKP